MQLFRSSLNYSCTVLDSFIAMYIAGTLHCQSCYLWLILYLRMAENNTESKICSAVPQKNGLMDLAHTAEGAGCEHTHFWAGLTSTVVFSVRRPIIGRRYDGKVPYEVAPSVQSADVGRSADRTLLQRTSMEVSPNYCVMKKTKAIRSIGRK